MNSKSELNAKRECKRCHKEYPITFFPIVRMHYDQVGKPTYEYRRSICKECYHEQIMASVSKLRHKHGERAKEITKEERLAYMKRLYQDRELRIEKKKRWSNYNIMQPID